LFFPRRWLIWSGFLLASCVSAHAQVTAAAGIAPGHTPDKLRVVPRVPGLSTLFDGLNAGITYSGVYTSTEGWYSVTTPAVNYTFSRRFSADASASIYFNRPELNTDPATAQQHPLVDGGTNAGDTLIGFHAFFEPGSLQDTITASMTAPTGDRSKGFGTGQVTYDFSNHLERYFGQFGLMLDVGAGNSSGLFNDLVFKDYNSVGGLAHFESGLIYWLPRRTYIEAVVYEQLPLGSQTIYEIVPHGHRDDVRSRGANFIAADDDGGGEGGGGGGGNDPPPTPQPVKVSPVSEDNGFTIFAGVPLNKYIVLSGYYNHSIRQSFDTVSMGLTYVVRGTSRKKLSMIDKALREAEGASQK